MDKRVDGTKTSKPDSTPKREPFKPYYESKD